MFGSRRFAVGCLRLAALVGLVALSACAPADPAVGITDPWEASNRNTHRLNKAIDRALLRPAGRGYVKVLPQPVVTGVRNVSNNFATPAMVVNNTLQGNIEGAVASTARFALNSTIGLVGLIDVATAMGIPEHDTDFGETLHVWGVREGGYVELPLLGPSTQRDAAGRVVDLFTNPLGHVLPKPEKYIGTAAGIAKRIGDRGRYSQTVDSVLYDSADSYTQGRVTYLQNRRYELNGDAEVADPYDDPYAATGDPYDDPYLQ